MTPLKEALVPVAVGAGACLAFLGFALRPADGAEAAFAACLLCLLVAAATGPFCFPGPAAVRCGSIAVAGALVCAVFAAFHGGPVGASLLAGLFCGLYAYALGSVAHLVPGQVPRLLLAAAGVALLGTLHYWDDLFLLEAADRKASAALAFRINAAAAASVTLGFDWLHAKVLYAGNQTSESLVGVARPGLGLMSLKLGAVAVLAALAGAWRRR